LPTDEEVPWIIRAFARGVVGIRGLFGWADTSYCFGILNRVQDDIKRVVWRI
jgi:hypothetical protein